MARVVNYGPMNCAVCAAVIQRTSALQKYCPPCSEAVFKKRKYEATKKWKARRRSIGDPVRYSDRGRKKKLGIQAKVISARESRGISWVGECQPDPRVVLTVKVPFTYWYSKNAFFNLSKGGHLYARKQALGARNDLSVILKSAMQRHGTEFYNGKLWLDILVQKPNHKGDAVNVVDGVCDAVETATGVNDRWYSIRRLDWEIVKEDPYLFVGVSQEITEDHRVCSFCGRALPLDKFWRDRRECADCRTVKK